jgi:hypothetical protein
MYGILPMHGIYPINIICPINRIPYTWYIRYVTVSYSLQKALIHFLLIARKF